MVNPADALQDPVTRHAERGQQRDWIAAAAESGHEAREALAKAAAALTDTIPGRRPGAEVAQAWAEVADSGPTCHMPRRCGAVRLLLRSGSGRRENLPEQLVLRPAGRSHLEDWAA